MPILILQCLLLIVRPTPQVTTWLKAFTITREYSISPESAAHARGSVTTTADHRTTWCSSEEALVTLEGRSTLLLWDFLQCLLLGVSLTVENVSSAELTNTRGSGGGGR